MVRRFLATHPRRCEACRGGGVVVSAGTEYDDESPPGWPLGRVRGRGFRVCRACRGGGHNDRDVPPPDAGWPEGQLQLTTWFWLQLVRLDAIDGFRPFLQESTVESDRRRLAGAKELRGLLQEMGLYCAACNARQWLRRPDGRVFLMTHCSHLAGTPADP